MNNIDRISSQYEDKVHIGPKKWPQILNFLKTRGVIGRIAESKIAPSILGNMIYNIHCVQKDELKECYKDSADPIEYVKYPDHFIKKDKFEFLVYAYLKRRENAEFYKNYKALHGEYIYVIFETNTNTIYTNCTKLQLELTVEKGITPYDYDNKTKAFFENVIAMEFLKNGWY